MPGFVEGPIVLGMKHDGPITQELVSKLSTEADVDPRTVLRALAGLPVKGRAGVRVARVIATHGALARSFSRPTAA